MACEDCGEPEAVGRREGSLVGNRGAVSVQATEQTIGPVFAAAYAPDVRAASLIRESTEEYLPDIHEGRISRYLFLIDAPS